MKKTILFILASIFITSNNVLAQSSSQFKAFTGKADLQGGSGGTKDFIVFIGGIVNIALGLMGVILAILLIVGGFYWMTAGGDTQQVDKAKAYIRNAIIGLIIALSAYSIANFVITALLK